jgi:hypothetical protein
MSKNGLIRNIGGMNRAIHLSKRRTEPSSFRGGNPKGSKRKPIQKEEFMKRSLLALFFSTIALNAYAAMAVSDSSHTAVSDSSLTQVVNLDDCKSAVLKMIGKHPDRDLSFVVQDEKTILIVDNKDQDEGAGFATLYHANHRLMCSVILN